MITFIFLEMFLFVSIIHLAASWKDNSKKRAVSKPFLILLLAGYYITAAKNISFALLGALLTSWLGDILLIPKGNRWLTRGGVSFVCSHILFTIAYIPFIRFKGWYCLVILPAAILYYVAASKVMHALKKTILPKMRVPIYIYLLVNGAMNLFALMNLLTNQNTGALLAYLGAVLFFISDCSLFLVRYHKNKHLVFKRHFTVMLTYIAGEFLITAGMLLLG